MSDDDMGRASGPSNPWKTVPEVNQPAAAPEPERTAFDRRQYFAASGGGGNGKVVYDDSEGGLTPLAIKGYLLTMVTMGIYRFWYLTDLRRFFWSHTSVHQSPLEYTGRGIEIFLGFLIALAVIIPLNLIPLFFVLAFGPTGELVSLVLFPIYAVLIFFAFYRSRRYRVNRTLWRGLRAHQTGAGWAYAFRALAWLLLGILTLGLIVPVAATDLYRYRVERMYLGSVAFSFGGDWRMIAKPYWVLWAIFALPLICGVVLAGINYDEIALLGEFARTGEFPPGSSEQIREIVRSWPFLLLASVFIWALLGLLAIPYYYARRTSAFFSTTHLHGVRCESHIRARSLYAVYGLYLLVLLLIFVVGGSIIGGLGYVIGNSASGGGTNPSVVMMSFGGIFVSYLGIIIVLGLAAVLILQRKTWKLVVGSVTILNPELLDELAGRMHDGEGGFGAGMADALDVGDFDIGL